MARTYGVPYPERQLMAVLSDLLGIEHFTTSKGSTVRRDFLEAVARRLEVPQPDQIPTKDGVLAACVEAATRRDMDIALFSPGGTVTDKALQVLIDGIIENWKLGPDGGSSPGSGPKAPADDATTAPRLRVEQVLPTGHDALETPLSTLEDLLDPDRLLGPVDRRLMAVAYREDQDSFRKAVLSAYRRESEERCCISEHGPSQVLQAAHIIGYAEGGVSVVSNGLCLRSDWHVLLDRKLVAIHETSLEVLVHPVLAPTPYWESAGKEIRVPVKFEHRPAPSALRHRRLAAGL